MSYKTYAEAKMANPDCEIVTTAKNWSGHYSDQKVGAFEKQGSHIIRENAWVICNPADYCSTLKEFLDAGFKLVEGDKFIGIGGYIVSVENADASNMRDDEDDCFRYILSAAALNGGCNIAVKAEKWTVYNNTLPLSELNYEQAGRLVKHSGEIEHMNKNTKEWGIIRTPTWNHCEVYRAKQKSERELFIEASMQLMTSEAERTMEQMFGAQFDAGARYTDLTQFFGENI